jgi:thiol:disulfide interchange protein
VGTSTRSTVAAFAIARARGLPDALTYAVAGLITGPIGILLAVFVRAPGIKAQ